MIYIDMGRMEYSKVREIQLRIHQKRVENRIPDILLLVEHPPVITLGKSGSLENLLVPLEELRRRNIGFYRIERGGDITYHGPGQIVGYPIFFIRDSLAGIRAFIERIEDALILSLKPLGVKAYKKEKEIGVWTEKGKIASIGIAVKRWVSFHGFALNVTRDTEPFSLINPCGRRNLRLTSIEEFLGKEMDMVKVKRRIVEGFERAFKRRFERRDIEAILVEDKPA